MNKLKSSFVAALAIGLSTVLLPNPSIAEEVKTMSGQVAEIITFKLVPGVNDQDFLKAGEVAGTFISGRKGFISRKLTRGKDGTYTDYVMWSTLADAESAMTASMAEASLAPFIQSIDPQSMKLDHQEVINTVN